MRGGGTLLSSNLKGFTLAEVLVTLGIIGVVAALTMPSVISNYKEKETIAKLKKTYSVLSQAYITAFNKYGSPDEWTWGPLVYPVPQTLAGYLRENLKVIKVCDNGSCFPDVMYTRLNGTKHVNYSKEGSNFASFVLQDGTLFLFWSSGSCSASHKTCGFIYTDINGKYPPNQWGRDMFGFVLTPTNIIPFGIEGYEYPFSTSCNKNRDSYLNGIGCTAWVIQNENMDYLHCDDLTWNGKTKCK